MPDEKDLSNRQDPIKSTRIDTADLKNGTEKTRVSGGALKNLLSGRSSSSTLDEDIHVLCDCSGSMSGVRIHQLKSCVEMFMLNRPDLNFIGFADRVFQVEASSQITCQGGTSIWAALSHSYSKMVKRIILLTDGQPTDKYEKEILSLVQESYTNIPIDTVGIGGSKGAFGFNREFLIRLSEITGGKFCEIADVDLDQLLPMMEQLLKLEHKPKPPSGDSGGGVIAL